MSDDIIKQSHFTDLIDTPHLIGDGDRLPGLDGEPGKGMKLREAVPLAELWWERTGRFQMPDFGKDPHDCQVKSGVMMGLPWFNLSKQEMLRVLAQWYAHIGIHTIIEGKSTSQDGDVKNLSEIRDDAKDVFDVLDTSSTHQGAPDQVETKEWKKEYQDLENEDKILDGQSATIEKENTNGKSQEISE